MAACLSRSSPRPEEHIGRAVPVRFVRRHLMSDDIRTPELLPKLSRGTHRSVRKGACFMERASFLAGERWSDHPACTHPLLAALARDVNDCTSDANRQRLVTLSR